MSSIDRKAILDGLRDSFQAYSTSDSRPTVEKVLNYGRRSFNLRRRDDIRREVVAFKFSNGQSSYEVDDEKPLELNQNWKALVYVDQADNRSSKDARHDRMLELTDQLIDWGQVTAGSSITADVWTITLTSISEVQEEDGYLSCEMNFQSRIDIS